MTPGWEFRSKFVRDSAVLVSGAALAQLAGVLSMPLITRLYDETQIGILGAFVGLLGVITQLACFRYEQALMVAEEREVPALAQLSFLICSGMAVLSVVIVALGAPLIAEAIGTQILSFYLLLIPLATCTLGVFQIAQVILSREQRYSCQSSARIAKTVTESAGQLGCAIVAGASATGLVAGVVAGHVIQAGLLVRATKASLGGLLRSTVHGVTMRSVAARYRNFPLFAVPSGVVSMIGNHGFTLILAFVAGIEAAGLFYLAHRVLALPTALISQSLGPVFYQRLSAKRGDCSAEQLFIASVFVGLLAVGAIVLIPLALIAPWAFGVCFGEGWEQSGRVVRVVWPAYLLMFAGLPITHVFYVYEKQNINLYLQLAVLMLRIVGVMLGHAWGGFHSAILAYGAVGVANYVVVFILALRWAGCSFSDLPLAFTNAVSKVASRIAHELRLEAS